MLKQYGKLYIFAVLSLFMVSLPNRFAAFISKRAPFTMFDVKHSVRETMFDVKQCFTSNIVRDAMFDVKPACRQAGICFAFLLTGFIGLFILS